MKNEKSLKKVVVVTKNYGTNFTGATLATSKYLEVLENEVDSIEVLCLNLGSFTTKKARINKFNSTIKLFRYIYGSHKTAECIYLSDDHLGCLLAILRVRYVHIYHGNWPDAMKISISMFLKSLYFIPLYFFTIRLATAVVHVSFYMESKLRFLNSKTYILRNGIKELEHRLQDDTSPELRIIMLGNVDYRKYGQALKLFEKLKKIVEPQQLRVDIYGRIMDRRLAKKLECLAFVNILGYRSDFSFNSYDLFLSMSLSENLSIAVCEALSNHVPVICYNVGGMIEIVRTGENGFLIPRGQVNKILPVLRKIQEKKVQFNFDDQDLRDFNWAKSSNRLHRILIDSIN